MAGIGFELKKLFRRKGLFATLRAYGYAGVICTGPMLLGVLLQVGMLVLCGWAGAARADQDLLVCMVTYTLLASLTVTSFFSMPVTRFLADMLYEEQEQTILPSLWGSNTLLLVGGCAAYGIFLIFSGATLMQGLLCLWLFAEMIVNWNAMSYLTAVKDYRGILWAFVAAIGISFGLGYLLIFIFSAPVLEGFLFAITVGYGCMMLLETLLLHRYFPQSKESPWAFLRWVDRFLPLAFTGLFTNLGLFAHLVIIWAGPIGIQVKGLFYGAPYHDVPAMLAFLSILITTVNFVVSVEVNFYPKYRAYYSLFNDGGVVGDIVTAEEEMLAVLNRELYYTALKQLFATAAVISLENTLLELLPLGFNDLMHGYFRTLCVGYGLYAIGNTVMLILLYFTDYLGAVLASGVFAAAAAVGTVISLFFDQAFYGFGFLAGAAVFFLLALLRLDYYTSSLPYRVLGQQPIVAQTKSGRFTKLALLLERQRKEGNLMQRSNLCGLLIGTALAVLLVGCDTAEHTVAESEPSTPESAVQTVEKEPVQEINGIPLRENKDLYSVYDDSGVVTMYLTVSSGNEAEGTNHTWAEINHYSVYDYEKMGVERYQVNGLLQVGDENGPVVGEVGYNEIVPNATVQIRGQTSSTNDQKNYKIELKKGKGTWRGQRTIALNKHMGEGLRFRNKMAYDLIEGIPQMTGLRTQFVHLYVRDLTTGSGAAFEDYGLYTQVEQLNKTALKTHGLDRNGQLYKVNSFEFQRYEDDLKLTTDPDYDEKKFEQRLETKGSSDHTKLLEMLQVLNDDSIPMEEILGRYFDAENIAYWMAFQLLTGNVDTQNRNCYLYSPLNSETWYILDWDNDGMLRHTEDSLYNYSEADSWEWGVSNYWGNTLFRRCLQTESFRARLDAAIEELHSYMNAERIDSMVAHYRTITEQFVWQMPDIANERLTPAQYDTVANSLSTEIEENYRHYYDSYHYPMPFYIGVPAVQDNKLHLVWDAAYDFDAESLVYTVEVAADYTFQNVLFRQENLMLPEAEMDLLPAGQYFMRVRVTNESGYTQDAFDYYVTDAGKIYGVKCFYVMADGSIAEDIYVEG